MNYAYVRISTNKQKQDRQLSAIHEFAKKGNMNIDRIFEDVMTGKRFDRPAFSELKGTVKQGDTIIVKEIDRLGRDWEGIKENYKWFEDRNINIIVIDVPLLSKSIYNEDGTIDLNMKLIKSIVLETYCFAAQNEREKISQRTKEALAVKKEHGIQLGRPKDPESQKTIDLIIKMHNKGCQTREIQFKTGKSRQYVCRIVKQYA